MAHLLVFQFLCNFANYSVWTAWSHDAVLVVRDVILQGLINITCHSSHKSFEVQIGTGKSCYGVTCFSFHVLPFCTRSIPKTLGFRLAQQHRRRFVIVWLRHGFDSLLLFRCVWFVCVSLLMWSWNCCLFVRSGDDDLPSKVWSWRVYCLAWSGTVS
jgi:hypothetical protein